MQGAFWLLGSQIPERGTLRIAEGMATAATIGSTLREPVVAAMNAGNLEPVAAAIKGRYPRLQIIICGDNDHRTPGNPGLTKASEAAKKIGGQLSYPTFCGNPRCMCSDFNDLYLCRKGATNE